MRPADCGSGLTRAGGARARRVSRWLWRRRWWHAGLLALPWSRTPSRPGRRCPPRRRYKCQALVSLLPSAESGGAAALPAPGGLLVIRARNHGSGSAGLFSALVTARDDYPLPDTSTAIVTMVVLGQDLGDYLGIGDEFAVWRGRDVGRGIVTRRIFV